MADIKHLLDDIRKNKYCVDMKETFCNALNEANANAEEIESNVKKIKDEIISINANAEVIDARCGEANLGDFNRKISSQLDTKANIKEIRKNQKIVNYTGGTFDTGAVLGVISNKEDDAKIQVCGFKNSSETSKYTDRDSVAFYCSNTGANPSFSVNSANYSNDYVEVAHGTDLSKIKENSIIDTKHTPKYSSLVSHIIDNKIYIKDGWFKQVDGGSTSPSIPSNGVGFDINRITKIWGRNTNVFIDDNTETKKMVGEELGLFDSTNENTSTTVWGIDVVNFGKEVESCFQARSSKNGFKNTLISKITDGKDLANNLICCEVNGKREFYIKNNGEMSKLKLKIRTKTDGDIQQANDPETNLVLISKNNADEVFNIKAPSILNAGEIVTLINTGTGNQLIGTEDGSNVYVSETLKPGFRIPSFGCVQLVSTGANWVVMHGRIVGSGYLTEKGGNITNDLSIGGKLNIVGTLSANNTIASAGNISAVSENSFIKTAHSAWNKGHFMMGAYHLWIDSNGRLRIKNGEPMNDTDGTIVGSQS